MGGRAGAVVAAVLAAGCGGSRTGDLSGTVSHRGRAVGAGWVTVLAADGTPVTAPLGPDGTYAATGLPAGPVRVGVTATDPRAASAPPAVRTPTGGKTDAPRPAAGRAAPRKYEDPVGSGLTFDLRPGPNRYDIVLE